MRHHAQDRRNPHPEDSTGTACGDGSGNSGDVSGAKSPCKSSAEGLELGDGSGIFCFADVRLFEGGQESGRDPEAKVSQLKEFCPKREHQADAQKAGQHRCSPYKGI